jgi:hypothetical protein
MEHDADYFDPATVKLFQGAIGEMQARCWCGD